MEVTTAEPVLEHPFTHLKGSIQPPGPHYIHESIEALDRLGMRTIESGKHDDFEKYLRETKNTICGRHPIGIVLAAFETLGKGKFKFVRYEQSTPVTLPNDSSVSYASAYAVVV
jgi:AmmeMemoRadiSam system protein B